MKILIIPICLLLSSCSLLKTKLPGNMGLSNSDIIIQKGAVLVEKGAIVVNNTFVFTISSGAFNTYLDRMSVFGGKEINK